MTDMITYNPGAIAEFASDVGSRAGQLNEIHSDVSRRTNELGEFFRGHGATEFFDLQHQMLTGLQGLIETIHNHGLRTTQVLEGAMSTDAAIPGVFTT